MLSTSVTGPAVLAVCFPVTDVVLVYGCVVCFGLLGSRSRVLAVRLPPIPYWYIGCVVCCGLLGSRVLAVCLSPIPYRFMAVLSVLDCWDLFACRCRRSHIGTLAVLSVSVRRDQQC